MQLDSFAEIFAVFNLEPWTIAILIPVSGMIFAGVIANSGGQSGAALAVAFAATALSLFYVFRDRFRRPLRFPL